MNLGLVRTMLGYSLPMIPNSLCWWVNTVSSRYVVLFFQGPVAAGLFTAASKLPSMVNMVSSIFQQAWQFSTAKEIGSSDKGRFFSDVFRGYSYLCSLATGALIALNIPICRLMLQSDFFEAWRYVPLLLFSAMLGCISTYFGTFYQALMQNKMLMVSTMVGAVANVVVAVALCGLVGTAGAVVASVVSFVLIIVVRIADLRQYDLYSISYSKLLVQCALVGAISVVASFTDGMAGAAVCGVGVLAIALSDVGLLKNLADMVGRVLQR